MNVALISPSRKAYSETFIQVHKETIEGKVFHYFSGEMPSELENGLVINSRKKRLIDLIKGHFNLNRFSLAEQAVISSFTKNKIDVVFAEYGGTGEKILSVCKYLGLPLLVHFHGYDASRISELERNNYYSAIFEYSSSIFVVSKMMYNDLVNMGCSPEKLKYNVYGPRQEFLSLKPEFSKPQFFFLGRFVDKKAPYYLIFSLLEVLKEFPKAQLILAGDGELRDSCENLVKHFGIEKSVSFPGVINAEEHKKLLSQSTAYIQHSITAKDGDAEGTPLSILEALAAGVPVISTYHAGIPDVVEQGESGFLVSEHDTAGMAEKMILMLRNKELAKEMGTKGRIRIKEKFSLENHMRIINQAISTSVISCKY